MLRVRGETYNFDGFGVGLLLLRLGERDRDLDFERYLDPEDELEADLCLIRRTGLGDLDTDLEWDLLGAFIGGLGGGDLDFTLGCSSGGTALVFVSFVSFVTSFPSTLISFFVSFFTLALPNKNNTKLI